MADEPVSDAQGQPDDAATEAHETALGRDATTEGQETSAKATAQDGTAEGEQTASDGKTDEAEGPPEAYEFTLPEGVELDEKKLGEFKTLAQSMGLTQDAAQKLVDLQLGFVEAEAAARETAFTETLAGWKETNRADAEFGGAKWDETEAAVGRLVERFGTKELKQFFNETGVGEQPEMVRFVYRLAQAISEDAPVDAGNAANAQTTPAQRLYGKPPA